MLVTWWSSCVTSITTPLSFSLSLSLSFFFYLSISFIWFYFHFPNWSKVISTHTHTPHISTNDFIILYQVTNTSPFAYTNLMGTCGKIITATATITKWNKKNKVKIGFFFSNSSLYYFLILLLISDILSTNVVVVIIIIIINKKKQQ